MTTYPLPVSRLRIKRIVYEILKSLEPIKHSWLRLEYIGIVFLTDKAIQELNKKYLNHNRPTDVMTFRYDYKSAEVVISLDTARKNSLAYDTSFKKEIFLYIIHGILHIMGYNDNTSSNRSKMFRKQEIIFSGLCRRV